MDQQVFVICRSVADGMTPGSIPGFTCAICSKPVQLSREGQRQMAAVGRERMTFVCNPCGFAAVTNRFASRPADDVVQINPEAAAAMERITGECVLDLFPTAQTSFDPLDCLRVPKKR